jgi:PIN domain nuclease of toxin-antitoxin system
MISTLDAPADLLLQLEDAGVLLIAQAEIEGATLLSADKAMRRYGVEVLW